MHRAAITGLGCCTPLGQTLSATWDALLAGKFISDHSRAMGEYGSPRVCSLVEGAAREAIAQARWSEDDLANAALVVGTSKGPVELWLDGTLDPCGLSEISQYLARELRFGDAPRLTLSTACASGLHALIHGAMLLDHGIARVLVVAGESSLHPLFISSFKRLGVIAPPDIGCRPLDENRAGFLVSEAAAAVCLERKTPNSDGGVILERFALAADATHLTAGDPTGRTLRRILSDVIDNRPVDLVHAHATGTIANDAVELAAIEAAVSAPAAAVFSHKGALGHSLGAAGLLSVVLNSRSHATGIVPPNVRLTNPLPSRGLHLSRDAVHRRIRRSIALASGFGGAAAAVCLES